MIEDLGRAKMTTTPYVRMNVYRKCAYLRGGECVYLHLSRCRRLRHIQMMMQQMRITMSRRAATAAIMIINGLAFHGCHQWCCPVLINDMLFNREQKKRTKLIRLKCWTCSGREKNLDIHT